MVLLVSQNHFMTINVMDKVDYKYIQFANYKDIPNWSVQYVVEEQLGFTKKFPMAKIGSFLKKSKNQIEIQDDVEYKQVTVKIKNGGVFARNDGQLKKGSEIGTKRQTIVHAGQFIVSKIDARNGAFGVIPEDLEGAIVTNDFPVFDVDTTKILPQFMVLISTTPQFVEFARKCSSGTTNRKRIDIDAFLQQAIPLPSLEVQKRILAEYNITICKAEDKERIIEENKSKMDSFILKTLGVKSVSHKQDKENTSFLSFVKLSKIERWDCYNERKLFVYGTEATPMSKLIKEKPMYGAPYSSKPFDHSVRYIRITDINEDGTLNEDKVSADMFNNTYLLKENDFLIARSGNTVGKTYLFKDSDGPAIFAGYLIKFEIDEEKIDPKYLLLYTKSSIYKDWIKNNMRVSAQPNINSQQYLQSPIIVPSKKVQQEIISKFQTLNDVNIRSKNAACSLRHEALEKFEQTIFE